MNQQNNDQALLPRRSRRLATIIPASHWTSIGYSEVDAQLMERMQTDIKTFCGRKDETKLCLRGRRLENDGALPYHDMLLPHWKKLFKALNGHTSVAAVDIRRIHLPVSVLDIMFPSFQSMNLNELRLSDSRLGNEGYQRLSTFLKDNRSLKYLIIGWDTMDESSVASSFSEAIYKHPTLELLIFYQCGFKSFLGTILEGCKRVSTLSLTHEALSSGGVAIADYIRSNPITEKLLLNNNKLLDSDADLMALALKMNTNLLSCTLMNNEITEEGEKNLLKALYDPISMDSIVECNHTCRIYTYDTRISSIVDQRPLLEQELFNINWADDISTKQKIRKKVVLALCGVDGELFDLSHLNDLPLQLMPRVLELIQEHSWARVQAVQTRPVLRKVLNDLSIDLAQYRQKQLEKDVLSRLFHTLRGWELPLLFQNLGCPSTKVATRKRRKTRR